MAWYLESGLLPSFLLAIEIGIGFIVEIIGQITHKKRISPDGEERREEYINPMLRMDENDKFDKFT